MSSPRSLSLLPAAEPEAVWFVACTRPRCEKKLLHYCARIPIAATLPCYHASHHYGRKTAVFDKPLFPGYLFLHMQPRERQKVFQSDYVANLLEVFDQDLLERQLGDILRALAAGLELRATRPIGPGDLVRISRGPLAGLEGWVAHCPGPATVLLRLDFIAQAAAVTVAPDDLELLQAAPAPG